MESPAKPAACGNDDVSPYGEALTLGNNICINKAVKCASCKENTAKLRVQLW